MSEDTMRDEFRGDNAHLIRCIEALVRLSDDGALRPHGIGGHARTLLTAAAARLSPPAPGGDAVACRMGDYGPVDPIEMATVLLMDEGRKVAECYYEDDARWIASLINAAAPAPAVERNESEWTQPGESVPRNTPAPDGEREAVAWQARRSDAPGCKWEDCTKAFHDAVKETGRWAGVTNGAPYEARALYTTPPAEAREPVGDARWITQTTFYDPANPDACTGNCTESALASIFALPLDAVPSLAGLTGMDFWDAFDAFVNSRGFWVYRRDGNCVPEGLYLASGPSSRGCSHMVVMQDGKLRHDPHPSREGIQAVDHVWMLVPFDPAAQPRDTPRDSGDADTKRLDWLEEHGVDDISSYPWSEPRWYDHHDRNPIGADKFPTLRALIDAAMQSPTGEPT